MLIVALLLLTAGSALGKPSLDPRADVRRFGVLGTMWLYWRAERRAVVAPRTPFAHVQLNGHARPHVVVVQSESFFDVRRLANADGVLRNFDALAAEAESGRLSVPVWGAYTMRTEFAFLSGIPSGALGVHRFNPYRRFARRGVATIASALRGRGYRTICVHPYPATFFARHRVFPQLGFDVFLDSAHFQGALHEGPYVADSSVAVRILEILRDAREPTFVFAITMENHGPLHLEDGDELSVYLRHLRNADVMFGAVAEGLRRIGDGVLCIYGDHVPGMPSVYAERRYDDPRTDYLLWRAGSPRRVQADRAVEELGLRVLARAGLAAAPA
jgi:phosphoglycerol transferase MdoB-like AlkP superfamily enzyme